jgi:hypothetical protein
MQMADLYFTLTGDLVINGNKDIAITSSPLQADIQQVYLRLMTEPGDFYIYPQLGIDLSLLYGMPQTPETGEFGKRLIRTGLQRDGIFRNKNIKIDAIPTSRDSIRFDVHIITDVDQPITLSVTQSLGA